MRIIGTLGIAVVAACVVPQQPQQQPTPYGQPQAAQGAAGAGTCPMLIDCYTRCTDATCISGCEAGQDPTVVYNGRTFTNCLMQNGCQDATCVQTRCSAETAACYGAPQVAQGAPAGATSAGVPPTSATMPVPTAGAHTELWMGLRQTGIGGSTYSMAVGWYVLFDDGRVLPTLPSEGLEGIDENQVAASLGTYTRNGKDVDMAFDQYRLTFSARADGGYDSREGSFWPVGSLDGATLDGAYGPNAGQREIAFSQDGRFDTTGGLMFNTGGNGLAVTPAGTGTYRIARNTLTLAYASGQVYRISITTMHGDEMPRPSRVFFGGFEYKQF